MKVEYINPFIEGVNELFLTMLGCEALRGKVGVAKAKSDPRDVTALIGLSGPARHRCIDFSHTHCSCNGEQTARYTYARCGCHGFRRCCRDG